MKHPRIGTYEISTGEARIELNPLHTGGFLLYVNNALSSHILPGEPETLAFDYMRWIATYCEQVVSDPNRVRITHLGGAACSLARYFAARWPRSRNTVVEIDARLAELVREEFDIPRAPQVKIRVGEAKEITEGFYPGSRDVVIRDVFSGNITPPTLSTVEFFAAVDQSLAEGGVYLANCGTHGDHAEVKRELAGMLEIFDYVSVVADRGMLSGKRYGNMVLVGSQKPIEPTAETMRNLLRGDNPAYVKNTQWARHLIAGSKPRRDEDFDDK